MPRGGGDGGEEKEAVAAAEEASAPSEVSAVPRVSRRQRHFAESTIRPISKDPDRNAVKGRTADGPGSLSPHLPPLDTSPPLFPQRTPDAPSGARSPTPTPRPFNVSRNLSVRGFGRRSQTPAELDATNGAPRPLPTWPVREGRISDGA